DYRGAEGALRGVRGADRPRAELALSHVLFETGRYADAREAALRAARSASLRTAAETLRGEALRAVGDRDGAIAVWRALADRPEARRARLLLGRAYTEAGDVGHAREMLDRFVEEYNAGSATDGESLGYVAAAVYTLGAFQDANDAYREATQAAPDRAEVQREWAE